MADDAFAGSQTVFSGSGDYNVMEYIARSVLNGTATATLVIVKAVTNDGGVEPVGLLDVQPMVAQLDGKGQATPHGTIHNVPYFRLQGGTNAVIIDPKVGDIGIAVFASRDISSVKTNKAAANPGSRRKFDYADALYIGGVLNGTPEQYIRFTSDGDIELKPASTVTIIGDLEVQGDVHSTGTITGDVDVIADDVSGKSHTHGGVDTGPDDTGPPN